MARWARRIARDERGFTLPEVLVAMLMMLTVMFALYSIFDTSLRVFSFGNSKVEAVENARLSLERMERELRAAYPVDKGGDEEGDDDLLQARGDDFVTFHNNLDDDREVSEDEEITYELDEDEDELLRNDAVLAGSVESFVLDYSDDSDSPDFVTIELEVVEENAQQDASQELETEVSLRNAQDGGDGSGGSDSEED